MQKIAPFLWFDSNAEEAIKFYMSLFMNSKIVSESRYGETGPGPAGSLMLATFELNGQRFMALNGGPHFKLTPAISLFVSCQTEQEVDHLWGKLLEGGMALMELDKYPFSEKFGWLMDRFGLTWQLNLAARAQKIAPFLMFVGNQHGKAEKAINFYTSLFKNSKAEKIERYGAGEPEPKGTVKLASFVLDGLEFMAIDSSHAHPFTFTEAFSFYVDCATQQEVDAFWEKLSAGGEIQMCGWLKDRFGVSWQIIPSILGELMSDKDPEKSGRVMQAMLQMKKIEIAGLQKAFDGD